MTRITFVVLFALVGCLPCEEHGPGVEIDPPPNADEAIELVADFYRNQTGGDHVHDVWWTRPTTPPGLTLASSGCCHSRVSWDGLQRLAYTVLAHEMAHCAIWALDGYNADSRHTDPFWWSPDGLVSQAGQLLIQEGL